MDIWKQQEEYDLSWNFIGDHLLGKVFHATSLNGALGILNDAKIKPYDTETLGSKDELPPMNLQLNRISLFNLADTTGQQISTLTDNCWPWPQGELDTCQTRVFFIIDYDQIKDRCVNYNEARKINNEENGSERCNKGIADIELFCAG